MSKHNSVTKRNRRPKSDKRADYTARTMAAVKELEQAAKLKVKLETHGCRKGKRLSRLQRGEQVNELSPNDVRSPEDLDDVLATIGTLGIDVLERQPKLPSSVLKRKSEEEVEPGGGLGLDLGPGAVEQTGDPVRIYLREMGVVPLLTREGEVDIAKRSERGQRRVLKALARSPIVIRQVLAIGEDLKRGARSIKEIVVFDDEEITDKVLQNGVKDITCRIDDLQKHYKR